MTHVWVWPIGAPIERTMMERHFECVNCVKSFKLITDAPKSAKTPEEKIAVKCPRCQARNVVSWPQGAAYTVSSE